ncbi:MAG: hypothetical protein KKD44_21130 [Proteobacteria bacterium]|nr:hypothetical protein [Pseudomonadota bacterium]
MKSMTIHGMDDQLAELIKAKAKSEGLSINKTLKKLLEISLGIKPQPKKNNIDDFKEFKGLWTESDLKEFEEQTADIRSIDTEDWQ